MHTTALIMLLLLSGRGNGASTRGGTAPPARWMANGVERSVSTTSAQLSKVMRFSGSVTSMDWTQVTPGIDGLGGGTFTVAVTVGGEVVCSLSVACDAPRGDYSKDCESAPFTAGADLDVKATSSPCLTPPVGFPSIDGLATN